MPSLINNYRATHYGSKKTLNIGMENQNLVVENGKITVYSDVKFSDLTHDEKHPERNKN